MLRAVKPPPELAAALKADAAAAAAFQKLPPSCRREYVKWVAEAKKPETRRRRAAQTIKHVMAGRRGP